MRACVHTCGWACVWVGVRACVRVRGRVGVRTCTRTHARARAPTRLRAHARAHPHAHSPTCPPTRTHARTHARTPTCTHARTPIHLPTRTHTRAHAHACTHACTHHAGRQATPNASSLATRATVMFGMGSPRSSTFLRVRWLSTHLLSDGALASRKARCSRRACACTALAWLAVPFIPLPKRSSPLDFDQHHHHYIYYYNQCTPEGLRHTHSVTLVGTTTSASRTKAVIFNSRRFQTDLFNCPHNLHPSR
jgi:hypothetical protein